MKLGKAHRLANRSMEDTERQSKKLVKRHDEYIQALNRSQEVISKRGLYRYRVMESIAVAGLLAGPVRKTIQDQTERAKLGTALKLADNENLREATKPIHDLARSIPLTADGLMKIGQAGAKIGVSRKNIVKFTEEVGKSLVAWRDTVDSGTVERIARLVKLQKISTSQLLGILICLPI